MREEEHRAVLEGISLSYPDFAESLMFDDAVYGNGEDILKFIAEHQDADSGQVLEYEMAMLRLISDTTTADN